MKTMKTLMVAIIGLALVLAAGTALASGKYRHGGPSYGAYHHGKPVYVDRHAYRYPVGLQCAWGYYPSYPRVYTRPVYRKYCAPYAPTYAYAPVYAPGWSFGFSFGW